MIEEYKKKWESYSSNIRNKYNISNRKDILLFKAHTLTKKHKKKKIKKSVTLEIFISKIHLYKQIIKFKKYNNKPSKDKRKNSKKIV